MVFHSVLALWSLAVLTQDDALKCYPDLLTRVLRIHRLYHPIK